jgi:endonuclease/exonuclease/phosphatase family metal-dependent hydrolase
MSSREPISWYTNQMRPLFDDIKEGDYNEPLKRLNNPYLNEYISKELNDTIINFYIKSMKDISILSIYPKALTQKNNIIKLLDKLKDNGVIHYKKEIKVNFYMMYNIIYQLYAHEKRLKSNYQIIYKLNKLGFIDIHSEYDILIIVYTHKNNKVPLKGNSSPFKIELRQLFTLNTEEDSLYDFLHANNDDNEAYEYANIFFNENSLRFLQKQQSWKILDMKHSINLFNRLKKFYHNYSLNEVENSIIFSSGILFSYGLREINDLDVILLKSNNVDEEEIKKINNDKIYDLDISYEKSPEFNKDWIGELNIRAEMCGAKDYRELILNPKFHYYFMGMKFLRLKCDILTRFKRGRPAQITDLLIIRQSLNLKYQLSIPTETKVYDEIKKTDIIKKVDENEFLKTIKFYLNKRYFINISTENIKKWIYTDFSGGGNNENALIKTEDMSNKKIIYPTIEELIKMGFNTNITIYSSNKPYLYEGEDFPYFISKYFCKVDSIIKLKNDSLRIMTFNIHNMISRCNQGISPIFGNNLNPFQDGRDVNRFINFFKDVDADILCLQEMIPLTKKHIDKDITDYEYIRNNFNFEYFNELMANIGYKYKVISSNMNGYFIKDEIRDYYFLGNAIYSKHPIIKSQIFQYNFLNRCFITTTIKYKNRDINVVNTHWEYFKDDNNKLIDQTDLLINKLNELYYFKNIILCGDFNINLLVKNKGSRYINWERRTSFLKENAPFYSAYKKNRSTNFHISDITDFILVSKKNILKCIFSNIIQTDISDHYPVFADFIFYS